MLEHCSGSTPGARSITQTKLPPDLAAVAAAVQGALVLAPAFRLSAAAVSRALSAAVLTCPARSGPAHPAAVTNEPLFSPGHPSFCKHPSGSAAAGPQSRASKLTPATSSTDDLNTAPKQSRNAAFGRPQKLPRQAAEPMNCDSDEERGWQVVRAAVSRAPPELPRSGAGPSGKQPRKLRAEELDPGPVTLQPSHTDQVEPALESKRAKQTHLQSHQVVTMGFIPPGCSTISDKCWPAVPADTDMFWVHDSHERGPRLAKVLSIAEYNSACFDMARQAAMKTRPAALGSMPAALESMPAALARMPAAAESVSDECQVTVSAASAVRSSKGSSQPSCAATGESQKSALTTLVSCAPAAAKACMCTGHSCQHHRRKCMGQRTAGSTFCTICKCTNCNKVRYRGPLCFGCAHSKFTPIIDRVLLLAPVLAHMMPADIEQFILLWPTVKSNLFVQVVIAWASEPFAMTYLAARIQPNATPAATYEVLLDACRHMVAQSPPHLTAVAQDISRNGCAEASGFLSAMVGLGVAYAPLSAAASSAAPASPHKSCSALQQPPHAAQKPGLLKKAKVPLPRTFCQLVLTRQPAGRSQNPISQLFTATHRRSAQTSCCWSVVQRGSCQGRRAPTRFQGCQA